MGATTTRPASGTGYPAWERPFLALIGAPANDAQLRALFFWQNWELGSYPAANNWLGIESSTSNGGGEWGPQGVAKGNTRDVSPGWWNVNANSSAGVASYATMAQGISALASFLQHGHPKVLAAFRDPNATVESIGHAVDSEPGWIGDGAKIIASDSGGQTRITPLAVQHATTNSLAAEKNTAQPGDSLALKHCDSKVYLINGLSLHAINACQLKAIRAGLLVGVGAVIIAGGLLLLGTKTKVGEMALNVASGGAKGLVKSSRSRYSGSPDEPTPTPAPAPTPTPAPARKSTARQREDQAWDDMYAAGSIDKYTWERGGGKP